jgi:hypothetical protein
MDWVTKPALGGCSKPPKQANDVQNEDGNMTRKIFHLSTTVVGMLLLFLSVSLTAQDNSLKPTVNHAVASGVSAPLRDLAKLPATPQYGFHEANPVHRIPMRPAAPVVDRVEQNTAGGSANYTIGINVLGVGTGFPNYTVPDAPPDTNMAVGDTQLVQWVNVSYAVFDKSGNALTGAILATPFGQPFLPDPYAPLRTPAISSPNGTGLPIAGCSPRTCSPLRMPFASRCLPAPTHSVPTIFTSFRSRVTVSPTIPSGAFGRPVTSRRKIILELRAAASKVPKSVPTTAPSC